MENESKTDPEEIPAFLPSLKPDPPPEGYFETFPDRVMDRWRADATATPVVRTMFRKWIAVAAVVLCILFSGWWWIRQSVPTETQSFTSAEAYQYVIEHINEFDGLLLQESQGIPDDAIQAPEASSVEDYLMEELQDQDAELIF